jgi:hypothetical protein
MPQTTPAKAHSATSSQESGLAGDNVITPNAVTAIAVVIKFLARWTGPSGVVERPKHRQGARLPRRMAPTTASPNKPPSTMAETKPHVDDIGTRSATTVTASAMTTPAATGLLQAVSRRGRRVAAARRTAS